MAQKGSGLVFAALQSLSSVTLGFAIADLGRISAAKEVGFFSAGIVFLVIALVVFYKYKLGSNVNPAITNPKVRGFLIRYPLFPAGAGMLVGILVMVVALRILGA